MEENTKKKVLYLGNEGEFFETFKSSFLSRIHEVIPLRQACLCTSILDASTQMHRGWDFFLVDYKFSSSTGESALDFYHYVRLHDDNSLFIFMNCEIFELSKKVSDSMLYGCQSSDIDDLIKLLQKTLLKNRSV